MEKKTGFQSPAEHYKKEDDDWNRVLITHPETTFPVEVGSDSMIELGFFAGRTRVMVDRTIQPRNHGAIVYVRVEGTNYIRQLHYDSEKRLYLAPANPNCGALEVTEYLDHEIIGKVTFSITKH